LVSLRPAADIFPNSGTYTSDPSRQFYRSG
jgi:hypothetical protein